MMYKDGSRIDFSAVVDRTKQSFRAETDVNHIIRQMGGLAFNPQPQGPYMDCVGVPDFLSAQNLIARARQQFDSLPASTRAKFENDPMNVYRAMEAVEADPAGVQLDLVEALKEVGYVPQEPPPAPSPEAPPTPPQPEA